MRRGAGPTVSLFPFLTVLLCASGTLIVLLIALSQHIRDEATAAAEPPPVVEGAEPEPSPPPADPAQPRPPRVIVRENSDPDPRPALRARRDAAIAAADELRVRLAAARRRTADGRAAAEGARAELERGRGLVAESAARGRLLTGRAKTLETTAERLAADAAALERRARAAEAAPPAPAAVLPVVRTAAGADVAAPVLVECATGGATFRPAGVTVPPSLLGAAADGSSPLAAGVRAADASPDAYVLLLVRPDGLPAFYTAAGALTAAGVRYGYELVDEDVTVAWGDRDEAARAAIVRAVRASLDTRFPAVAVGPGGPGRGRGNAAWGESAAGPPAGGRGGGRRSGTSDRPAGRGNGSGSGRSAADPSAGAAPPGAGPFGEPAAAGRGIPGFAPGTPVDRIAVGPAVRGDALTAGGRQGRGGAGDSGRGTGRDPHRGRRGAGGPEAAADGMPFGRPAANAAGRGYGGSAGGSGTGPSDPTGGAFDGGGPRVSQNGTAWPGANGAEGAHAAGSDPAAAGNGTAGTGREGTSAGGGTGGAANGGPSGPAAGTAPGPAAPSPAGAGAPATPGLTRGGGSRGGGGAGIGRGTPSQQKRAGGSQGEVTSIMPGLDVTLGDGAGDGAGGAAGDDGRIRFAVAVPAVVSRGHLWVRDRWVPLPTDAADLRGLLADELSAALAGRGAPPEGFRWAPEVRLGVRPDGAADVPGLTDAFQSLDVPLRTAAAPPAESEVNSGGGTR